MSQQLATLKQTLTSEAMREQFARSLPSHLTPERFARIAITALTRTPKLLDCTPESLMRCLLDLSAFGLEPDGRRAHLIPYGAQCTLVIDWKGLAELAMRSGVIAKLHADVVCENDTFEYNLGAITCHKIDFRKPRGDVYAVYALAQTKTGEVFVAVLSKDEVEAVRKRSRSGTSGPWVSDWNEMAKKTAFRRLSKWLPLSAEFRDAQERDDEQDREVRDVTPIPEASASKLFKSNIAALPEPTEPQLAAEEVKP
jgi:recombination protein RecT